MNVCRLVAIRRTIALGGGIVALLADAWGSGADGLSETPLAPRSGPRGATLFTPVPAERSGIVADNPYADPRMWAERYQELVYGAMGTGVAVGDYDNDGRPDLFLASKTGPSRLFRNLGDWKFEDVTARAGLLREASSGGLAWVKNLVGSSDAKSELEAWRQGVTFVDINNDGWLDLYLCRFGAPNLLYVNQRDGTFKEEAAARGLAVTDASGMAAFCDYDRDGWLDVYVVTSMLDATAKPEGQRDYLFRNRGDGTFVDVSAAAGIAGEGMGHSATWWDFDHDGWPDLYVANDYAAPDRLYRNNRDGTFTEVAAQALPRMPYYAMGADLGDVNNDGLMDLLVADMAASTRTKDLRGMAGSRARAQQVGDDPARAAQLMHNALYLGTGTAHVREAARLAGVAATDWTWSVRFEDLDNDGWLDLHVTNGMSREYHNADLLEKVMAVENPAETRRAMKAMPVFAESNLAFRNRGDLTFEEVGAAWGLDQVGVSFGAAFADFDGDGDLDLVFANYEAPPTVLRNDSERGHRVTLALRGSQSNRFGVGATVKLETAAGIQVRQLSLARGYLSSSEPILHFGLGDEARVARMTVTWPSGVVQTFEDLAGDRKYTISEPPPASAIPVAGETEQVPPQFRAVTPALGLTVTVAEDFDAAAQPMVARRFDRSGPALAVGDLNGDGVTDVVVGGSGRQPAQLWRGGRVFSSAATFPPSEADDGPWLIVDVNGDGRPDLLQTKTGTSHPAGASVYQPVVHLQQADGGWRSDADALPKLSVSVGAAAAADFDRDGTLDVFLGARVLPGRYPEAPESVLLCNRGGRFEDVTTTWAPALRNVGMVTAALATDVDGDGWVDLLLALEWGGIKYFRNEEGRGFVDRSESGFNAAGTGWWTALAAADFNGDGQLDYVAGNVGLNTPYRADETHPALLFAGRLGGTGTQLIEAAYTGDFLQPRLSRSELAARLPSVARRFAKQDDYARASLEQIVGADRLTGARRYAATELRSGVFLSQPDGTHRFVPLPMLAQLAPMQGVVAGDFDGDGHADIYLLQNSYAPVTAVGPLTGGLSQLWRGDGRGGFEAVAATTSGLVVPGDAKALVVLDLNTDGWPDFIASRNQAELIAWRNAGVAGRRSMAVVLRGTAGNSTAIGARVTVEFSDGTKSIGELAAGGGYFSQSAPAVFVGYDERRRPQRIVVRWPDGETTTHPFREPVKGELVIQRP